MYKQCIEGESAAITVTRNEEGSLKKWEGFMWHMQGHRRADLEGHLALCPPGLALQSAAKEKMATHSLSVLFYSICQNRTLHSEGSQALHSCWETLGPWLPVIRPSPPVGSANPLTLALAALLLIYSKWQNEFFKSLIGLLLYCRLMTISKLRV